MATILEIMTEIFHPPSEQQEDVYFIDGKTRLLQSPSSRIQ